MKTRLTTVVPSTVLALSVLLSVVLVLADDAEKPAPAAPAERLWLEQLVGEWTVVSEASMGPDTEPMRAEGSETVRKLGDQWFIAEGRGAWAGTVVHWVLTLGYDPNEKRIVGTWIDSSQPKLWSYVGEFDDAQRVLTLNTKGPSFGDPTKIVAYRETLEVKSKDHRTFVSSIQGEDGQWTSFMRVDYRRKAK
ncbi:MAG: DUF1579 domain-containing protein [Planctomycetota bacterium]